MNCQQLVHQFLTNLPSRICIPVTNIRLTAWEITKHIGIIENWGRWSEMVTVKLPDTMSGSITFENILFIGILKWLVNSGWV